MPLVETIKNAFAFKEPQPEPGFLLAGDEPEEVRETVPPPEQFADESVIMPPERKLTGVLESDGRLLEAVFGGEKNQALTRRDITVAGKTAAIFFLEKLAGLDTVSRNLIGPISRMERLSLENIRAGLTAREAWVSGDLNGGIKQLLRGSSLVLLEGETRFLIVRTGAAPHRAVAEAIHERVVRGPQEGFTEDLETNLALVQKRLRTHRFACEYLEAGSLGRTRLAILSVNGITNPRLIAEVKRRIQSLKIAHLSDSGMLEQLIEDKWWHPYPQILVTERPDRIAAGLAEGKAAVLVDGSYQALLMPATLISLLHAAEDYNVRWPYGLFMRLVRILAAFVMVFLPSLYIVANLYQPELLPTDLLFSLAAIKQYSPLPTIIEVLLIELVFEIMREAGHRGPRSVVTPLIIVIGVVLGLVAVFTHLINPVLLLVVLLTAIAAFVMPEFSVGLSFRLTRYSYTLAAFTFGLIGIVIAVFIHLHLLVKQKSFGVPMLAPIAPFTKRSKDIILMSPVWLREKRPDFLDPGQIRRQPEDSRGWLIEQSAGPVAPELSEGGKSDD
ncbi:MAG: spore germination protein [Bacteroidota bacterium]